MDAAEVRRAIVELAQEDDYGLHEILWRLDGLYPDVARDEKRHVARQALAELLAEGRVQLLLIDPVSCTRSLVQPFYWAVFLDDPQSWHPGEESYVGFGLVEALNDA